MTIRCLMDLRDLRHWRLRFLLGILRVWGQVSNLGAMSSALTFKEWIRSMSIYMSIPKKWSKVEGLFQKYSWQHANSINFWDWWTSRAWNQIIGTHQRMLDIGTASCASDHPNQVHVLQWDCVNLYFSQTHNQWMHSTMILINGKALREGSAARISSSSSFFSLDIWIPAATQPKHSLRTWFLTTWRFWLGAIWRTFHVFRVHLVHLETFEILFAPKDPHLPARPGVHVGAELSVPVQAQSEIEVLLKPPPTACWQRDPFFEVKSFIRDWMKNEHLSHILKHLKQPPTIHVLRAIPVTHDLSEVFQPVLTCRDDTMEKEEHGEVEEDEKEATINSDKSRDPHLMRKWGVRCLVTCACALSPFHHLQFGTLLASCCGQFTQLVLICLCPASPGNPKTELGMQLPVAREVLWRVKWSMGAQHNDIQDVIQQGEAVLPNSTLCSNFLPIAFNHAERHMPGILWLRLHRRAQEPANDSQKSLL